MGQARRATWGALGVLVLASALWLQCSDDNNGPTGPGLTPRSYLMGFSGIAPRPDISLTIQTIDLWATRADAALILSEPPWVSLLAGAAPDSLVRADQLGLANYYRSKGLRIIASVDPTNGLNRASDSQALVDAGRSLTEPAIQQLYRRYVTALDTIVHPEYLSVVSETNLIRAIAPPSLYDALVAVGNGAAADVRAVDPTVKIFGTVQVEVAWGKLVPGAAFVGVDQDRVDFPFLQVLGLSSYPYLGGFTDPDSIPNDYYSALTALITGNDPLPEMVIEGGWPSDSAGVAGTPEKQDRYIVRHQAILDRAQAIGWFQITFTDLDVANFPVPPGTSLGPFAHLGLVDKDLAPKPALAVWDAAFRRPRE
jgi:hypothetical protein